MCPIWAQEMGVGAMFDFIVIDFETATSHMDSACSVGIVALKNLKIVDSFYSLIQPPDNKYEKSNITVHKITPDMTTTAPSLTDLWEKISHYFNEHVPVVAHNANFDMSALRLGTNAQIPNFPYVDSMNIAANYVSGSLSLSNCVEEMGISLEDHHNALKDAEASAQIVLKALDFENCLSLWEYIAKGGCNFRYFGELKVRNNMGKSKKPLFEKVRISDIHQTVDCIDHDSPLYGKSVVFTGQLSISREEAMTIAANHGAVVRSRVSKKTDFLVVGEQDMNLVGEDGLSNNEREAKTLNDNGQANITLLKEEDFLRLVHKEVFA